ncbi:MAG TPA: hypothetical protein VFU71_22795 [Burkholderiaceae bacterium]|nr:hypothetical protein [Burkholderiaceae bacterium]
MNAHRALAGGLGVACWALTSAVSAQAPSTAERGDSQVQGAMAYACVDPSDASARRRFQDEPCRWPMLHLPVTPSASASEPKRWPVYPPKEPGAQDGHAMFWRFPVQPMGPYEVPRHSRR